MVTLTAADLAKLVSIESHVHYGEPPPPGREPFVYRRRSSPVLISAPHGAMTRRNSRHEEWHQEDDYTAGLALLLAERCRTSVIATLWRTDGEDPNHHVEGNSAYKRALKSLVEKGDTRWVIDLHAARDESMPRDVLVDLGTRREKQSLPPAHLAELARMIEGHLGAGSVSHNIFPARVNRRTITAYSHGVLGLQAVQIEMKSAVRVPERRVDATAYAESGPFAARPHNVVGMLQALADFVGYVSQESNARAHADHGRT
jgi:hypothetical protein